MDKSSLDALAASVAARQLAAAQAVSELRTELSPASLAALGKEKAADAVRSATLEPSGRPKPWLLVTASVAFALLVTGIVLRVVRRQK
ncbi:MAG: hypothetical protein LBK95_01130 [Bifidobacteriaceae bacterium]|jgi:ABC-type cobalamin transport system permease subunit|nr:hypothetical protein [Bifidobacteriaceae bacterium]